MDNDIEKDLQHLGLSYYESKILNFVIKEKTDIRSLSKKSRVPFGKIYSIIKSLKEKGLVKETNSRPKLIYTEKISDVIAELIKEKQEKEQERYENLRKISTMIDKQKGEVTKFFQIGTTNEDNKKIQLRSFEEAETEVLQILNIHHKPSSNRANKHKWEKAIIDAVKRGVIFKAIYPKKTELPVLLKELHAKNPQEFQVKRKDTDFVRCDIIDRKKVMIKLVHDDPLQYGGIIFIEDEKLAENLNNIFYTLWND